LEVFGNRYFRKDEIMVTFCPFVQVVHLLSRYTVES
jgi:hypothetical protein